VAQAQPRKRRIYVCYASDEQLSAVDTVQRALWRAGYQPVGRWSVLGIDKSGAELLDLVRGVDGAIVLVGADGLDGYPAAHEVTELLTRRDREGLPVVLVADHKPTLGEMRATGPSADRPLAPTLDGRIAEAVARLDAAFREGTPAERSPTLFTTRVINAQFPVTSVALGEVAGRPTLVAGCVDGAVRLWDLGRPAGTATVLSGHRGPVSSVAVGETVISGSVDGTVLEWSAGQPSTLLEGDAPVNAVATGRFGENRAVLCGNSKGVSAISGGAITVLSAVNDIALDRAGTAFVARADGNIEALQPQFTSPELAGHAGAMFAALGGAVFTGHTGEVSSVAVGGDALFSGGADGTVRRWDTRSGQETHRFHAHPKGVNAVATGVVDGVSTVVTGGMDGLVQLWYPHENSSSTLSGHSGPVRGVAVGTLDGKPIVVSGGGDGTIRIWGTPVADQVDWLSDAPSRHDLLHRMPLARTIAARLRRMNDEAPDTSFLVHIDGPWGAGKSTLLNFLDRELSPDFTTVTFDAWREAGVGPAWWALLTALRTSVRRQRGWLARGWLLLTESAARLRRVGAPFLLAVAGLLAIAGGILWLFTPVNLKGLQETAAAVAGVAAAVGTLWAGTLVASRFLLWDSARGARLFEQSNTNPMLEVTRHFGWLLRKSRHPVVFLVDDLDRCPDGYVVELLDSVQTLVRDAGPRSAHFVVSADGAWIRTSYELHYATFADAIAEPGQPLGYLFLDKFFQLRIPVPSIDATRQRHYLRELLRGPAVPLHMVTAEERRVREQLKQSVTEAQVVDTLRSASDEVRTRLAGAALDKLTTPEAVAATEHSLQRFAVLLPPNPRAMKRFVNTYSAMRAVRTLEGNAVRVESLALWTIIEIRWPSLADHLRANPESIALVGRPASELSEVPDALRPLFTDPALRLLTGFDEEAPLDAALIRTCCGAGPV
jgi:hypothetical protein